MVIKSAKQKVRHFLICQQNWRPAKKEQRGIFAVGFSKTFIQNRLLFQIEKALYDRKIDKKLAEKFENFFKELPSIFPQEKSSLIHGDLWTGNVMVNESGLATLVDPTCYYGFREADIAFSTMFGGFEEEFYKTYNEHFPLEKGFHARIPYYNLYPLLVHVNLFGEGYIPTIETILKPF